MHASWLVEVATLWAYHNKVIGHSESEIPNQPLHAYWAAARSRADNWAEALHEGRLAIEARGASKRMAAWHQLQSTIEEVFLSEVLTRVVAAMTTIMEQKKIDQDCNPIAISVHVNHLEARHRCLQLLVGGPGLPVEQAVHMNRLRFYLEEWTDMLLAYLSPAPCAQAYCFQVDRVQEFADDIQDSQDDPHATLRHSLLLAGLRRWMTKHTHTEVANHRLNEVIGRSSLGMLREDLFDSHGTVRSLRSHRIERIVDETDGYLSDLIYPERSRGTSPPFHAKQDRYHSH